MKVKKIFKKIFLQKIDFFKNKLNSENLNSLWHIFFVLDVFQSFDVDIWPLLKVEKVIPRSRF